MGLTESIAIAVGIVVCILWSMKNDSESEDNTDD